MRLAARSDLRRVVFIILVFLVFPFVAGGDLLCRIFAIIRVQSEPLRRRLDAVLVQLRDEDTGVRVLGDRRRANSKVTLHRHQLSTGFLPKCGQLG